MYRYFFILLFIIYVNSFSQIKPDAFFELQNGDLIFQESCDNGMGEAIKQVTQGIDGYNFTHVGMVWINPYSHEVFVIEATHPKVRVTALKDYLVPEEKINCPPRSVVGRLKETYQPIIPQAIQEALQLVGKEYDDAFDLSNDQYYCSELIYKVLYCANNHIAVFPLNKMTFKSSKNGEFNSFWISHFKNLGIPVPEGEWGINPGAMSQSDVLNIVYFYQ
ncbi:YiiX/YebB-like N1pC/P60 family cysteine hydrolase [Apibacter sp. HY039]|uniref:YiiX/YebB-like N1pC/P60 family cysteine hydrolase n=1 Tax=Apibacter sp. HY039 TaxID=2501476 RepID=UPI000FEB71D8|nr:YiiX/YebB-like N1pC/P60 family cysteine hydrolase [Apibacter sp. HY039]